MNFHFYPIKPFRIPIKSSLDTKKFVFRSLFAWKTILLYFAEWNKNRVQYKEKVREFSDMQEITKKRLYWFFAIFCSRKLAETIQNEYFSHWILIFSKVLIFFFFTLKNKKRKVPSLLKKKKRKKEKKKSSLTFLIYFLSKKPTKNAQSFFTST